MPQTPMVADAPARSSRLLLVLGITLSTLALDLWSKAWAWEHLRAPGRSVTVIDPLLEFEFSFNTGSAFGFLTGVSWARTFFIAVTVLALAYTAWLSWTMPTRARTSFVAAGLVSAGALGNLHDRLVRLDEAGRYGVVDFVKINYPWGGSWPTFNVADVLLLAGVGLLFFALRDDAPPDTAPAGAGPASADA
jgi:signal peptidase II